MVFPLVILYLLLVKSVQKTIHLLLETCNLYQTTLPGVAWKAKHGRRFIPLLSRMFKFPAWVPCQRKPVNSRLSMTSPPPPHGNSGNDAIPTGAFSLQYESVDTAVNTIMKLGRESYLTNIDIRNAFRLCSVAPADMHLLGIKWACQYYFEWVLPFGLRSSPFIFDKLAFTINWILADTCHLEHVMHYLDDFLDVCPHTFTWLTITRHFSLTHSPICTSPWRPRRWKACPRS